jgi:hypothetical protein
MEAVPDLLSEQSRTNNRTTKLIQSNLLKGRPWRDNGEGNGEGNGKGFQ